jgi:hypothetical protein
MLVISGVPGAGKSRYSARLELIGWKWLNTDTLDRNAPDELESLWLAILTHRADDVGAFVDAAELHSSPVVVEVGYCLESLPVISALQDAGAECWWFSGDCAGCLRAWRTGRELAPDYLWMNQIAAIAADWPLIASVYGESVLTTMRADGPLTAAEIDAALKPG